MLFDNFMLFECATVACEGLPVRGIDCFFTFWIFGCVAVACEGLPVRGIKCFFTISCLPFGKPCGLTFIEKKLQLFSTASSNKRCSSSQLISQLPCWCFCSWCWPRQDGAPLNGGGTAGGDGRGVIKMGIFLYPEEYNWANVGNGAPHPRLNPNPPTSPWWGSWGGGGDAPVAPTKLGLLTWCRFAWRRHPRCW